MGTASQKKWAGSTVLVHILPHQIFYQKGGMSKTRPQIALQPTHYRGSHVWFNLAPLALPAYTVIANLRHPGLSK
jgi:hypothetical protein